MSLRQTIGDALFHIELAAQFVRSSYVAMVQEVAANRLGLHPLTGVETMHDLIGRVSDLEDEVQRRGRIIENHQETIASLMVKNRDLVEALAVANDMLETAGVAKSELSHASAPESAVTMKEAV